MKKGLRAAGASEATAVSALAANDLASREVTCLCHGTAHLGCAAATSAWTPVDLGFLVHVLDRGLHVEFLSGEGTHEKKCEEEGEEKLHFWLRRDVMLIRSLDVVMVVWVESVIVWLMSGRSEVVLGFYRERKELLSRFSCLDLLVTNPSLNDLGSDS